MTSFASPLNGPPALTPSLIAFYATTATVIPVLFIALVVQGTTVQRLARFFGARATWSPARRQTLMGRVLHRAGPNAGVLAAMLGPFLLLVLIVAAGGRAESLAIYALYQGQAMMSTGQNVLGYALILVIVVAILPFLTFFGSIKEFAREREHAAAPSAEAEKAPPAGPDKADAE